MASTGLFRPDVQTVTYEQVAGIYSAHDEVAARASAREAGWLSGGTVTGYPAVTPTQLIILAGNAIVDGKPVTVADQALPAMTVGNGRIDATLPRWILVEVDANGTVQLVLGTPATDPLPPQPTDGRAVAAAIFVRANDTQQSIAQSIGTVDTRVIPLRILLPTSNDYSLTSIGLTVSDTATDVTAGFNDILTWTSLNQPTARLVIDPGIWTVNGTVVAHTNNTVDGADPLLSIVKLADATDLGDGSAIFEIDQDDNVYNIKFRGFTVDGNRYNQTVRMGCISFTSGAYHHHLYAIDMRLLRPYWYGIANSGVGYREFIYYIRPYAENCGSDGFDSRGGVPWGENQYCHDAVVNGFGFNDDLSSVGIDLRGNWVVTNPKVMFIQRLSHGGVRYHFGDGFDGTGNRYPNMLSRVSNAFVALTGHRKNYGLVGYDPTTHRNMVPGDTLQGLVTPRPVPVPFGAFGTVGANTVGSPSGTYTYVMSALTWDRLPRPWTPVELCVVSSVAAGTALPPTVSLWGLIWVQQKSQIFNNRTMTVFRAMPSFMASAPVASTSAAGVKDPNFRLYDAHDWSNPQAGTGFPNAPTTVLHSAAPVATDLTLTFAATQQYVAVGIVEIKYGSTFCGLDADGTTNFGAHADDVYVQSVGFTSAPTTTTPAVTLAALQNLGYGPDDIVIAGTGGLGHTGRLIENPTAAWFFDASTTAGTFTPSDANNIIIDDTSAGGRRLVMIHSPGAYDQAGIYTPPDATPSGTISAAGTVVGIGHEYLTGRV